jgi:hypothetical protein
MTITADIAAKGVILRSLGEGRVVFHPHHSNYELYLESPATFADGQHVRGVVRVRGRKVYTVPSGGGFVQPVLGTPRIIQGRVVTLDEREIVVKAGNAIFVVELPTGTDTIDLHAGDIAADSLVNVVALPGARFDLVG